MSSAKNRWCRISIEDGIKHIEINAYRNYHFIEEQTATIEDYLVNGKGEKDFNAVGATGYPYFGQLILDCLNRTENAMTQHHCFKAAELCLIAQQNAVRMK